MRKTRHAVYKVSDLLADVGMTVSLGDGECTLFLHDGKVYAVGSLCPHQNAPLHGAPAEQGMVICRRHGYRFHLKTGDCATVGGYGVPVYEVAIEHDTVIVSVWDFD